MGESTDYSLLNFSESLRPLEIHYQLHSIAQAAWLIVDNY